VDIGLPALFFESCMLRGSRRTPLSTIAACDRRKRAPEAIRLALVETYDVKRWHLENDGGRLGLLSNDGHPRRSLSFRRRIPFVTLDSGLFVQRMDDADECRSQHGMSRFGS